MKVLLLIASVVCLGATAFGVGPEMVLKKKFGIQCADFSGTYSGQCTIVGGGSISQEVHVTQDVLCSSINIEGESYPINGKRYEETRDDGLNLKTQKWSSGKTSKDGKTVTSKLQLVAKSGDVTATAENVLVLTDGRLSVKFSMNGKPAVSCDYHRQK